MCPAISRRCSRSSPRGLSRWGRLARRERGRPRSPRSSSRSRRARRFSSTRSTRRSLTGCAASGGQTVSAMSGARSRPGRRGPRRKSSGGRANPNRSTCRADSTRSGLGSARRMTAASCGSSSTRRTNSLTRTACSKPSAAAAGNSTSKSSSSRSSHSRSRTGASSGRSTAGGYSSSSTVRSGGASAKHIAVLNARGGSIPIARPTRTAPSSTTIARGSRSTGRPPRAALTGEQMWEARLAIRKYRQSHEAVEL